MKKIKKILIDGKTLFTETTTAQINNTAQKEVIRKVSLHLLGATDDQHHNKINTTGITSPTLSNSSSSSNERKIQQRDSNLKSTSLIMRTIRSASQFDEAMKKLDDNNETTIKTLNTQSITESSSSSSALKLISQMNAITKSNSANSLSNFRKSSSTTLNGRKYSSSLDGDCILSYDSDIDKKKNYYTRISDDEYHIIDEIDEQKYHTSSSSTNKPIAAPRMKKIGPSNVISHQLSQLRRLYEAAEQESDDSAKADEEVKHYLGNLAPVDEKTTEISGSWSRIKAKRSVAKQNTKDDADLKLGNKN